MKRVSFALLFALICMFLLVPEAQAQEPVPRFVPSDCPIAVPSGPSIACGELVARQDDDDPKSRTIRLPVIIVHSRHANPSKEALLFTEGGPGYSSLASVWWLADTEFWDRRDIVILEQRGNKYADPSLDCDFSVWREETEGHTPCLDHLRQRGVALESYNTASVAADIHALKQALDYESWILYGTSYSTRLMQLVMAHYPEDVRGVVLHSISPITDTRYQHEPEHAARVLQVMFDDCAADPACAEAYPELEDRFYGLVQKLNDEPVALEMTFPGSTERTTVDVDGATLIDWMAQDAFYGPAYPPFETAYLPLLIDKLSRGHMGLLYPWAKEYLSRWGNDAFMWGLYFAINCQDDAPSASPEMVEAQIAAYPELDGYYRFRDELDICTAWGLDPAPPLAAEPVVSDIPTLVLAGRYDPITPPGWSRIAVANLSDSVFVEFPASGHSVISDNPCAQQITAAFLNDPGRELDLSCMGAAPSPAFVLPHTVIIASAMYELRYGEMGYSMLEERLFLGSWLTLWGTGVTALVVGLIRLVRKRNRTPPTVLARLTILLLIALALTTLIWGFALRSALWSIADATPNVLRFGLPVAYGWAFAVAIAIGLMTVALIVIAALAWTRGYGSVVGRIALSLATLAAITFSSLLAYWGLLTALLAG